MIQHEKWNRSSALDPEALGTINSAVISAVDQAIHIFESKIDAASLSDKQRAEAYRMLAEGVSDGIDKFIAGVIEPFKK